MFLGADEAIPVFPLPQCPGPFQMPVDPVRGEAFPTVNDITELIIPDDTEKDVNMVRHHDEGSDGIPVAVEVMESIRDDPTRRGVAEEAGAVAAVQQFLEAQGEEPVGFFQRFLIPRLGMGKLPILPLLDDFPHYPFRQ